MNHVTHRITVIERGPNNFDVLCDCGFNATHAPSHRDAKDIELDRELENQPSPDQEAW